LGGGIGQLTYILEYIGFDVINTDIAIKNQDKKNIKVDFNNVNSLPLSEKSFDIGLCQEVIEHIENPWRLLRLARKYIKDGGLFYLTTPNIHSARSKKCFAKTNYFNWFRPKNISYHINPLPFWEIKMIAEKSGYKLVNLKGSGDYFFSRNNENENKILENNDILIFKFLCI
jgi:SAM-dependent methyltransferase